MLRFLAKADSVRQQSEPGSQARLGCHTLIFLSIGGSGKLAVANLAAADSVPPDDPENAGMEDDPLTASFEMLGRWGTRADVAARWEAQHDRSATAARPKPRPKCDPSVGMLGRCFDALAKSKRSQPPVTESKLTAILAPGLGGPGATNSGYTSLLLCTHPSASQMHLTAQARQ